ncbi:hypothetical protein CC86DRAFT_410514 [Ophiobolus disseminans]|uniref:Piwi domain-containing protein n=1 Tax=Ophiobolus disseminans TaxID=1469910 RepID=A0A6A6ZM45_9PLEO|nr:hypothetical protein CC86DRAFT_410514 [Ophiobolus disseminans]
MSYPEERPIVLANLNSTGTGRPWSLSDKVRQNVESRQQTPDIQGPKHPLRTAFIDLTPNLLDINSPTEIPETQILTNHFDYDITATTLWEYRITGFSGTRKDKIKHVFHKAIDQLSFLKLNTNSFATNYYNFIVSWVNLHELIDVAPIQHKGLDLDMWELQFSDGDQQVKLHIKLHQTLEMGDVRGYTDSEARSDKVNFDYVSRCMNMIISKSFNTTKVHQQSANKFFDKNARAQLKFTNLNLAWGNIILNFSLATSAFFRPVRVNEFLADTSTFPDEGKCVEALRNLQVFVLTERKQIVGEHHSKLNAEEARVKRVTALGPNVEILTFHKKIRGADGRFEKNPNGTFRKEATSTSVVQYLKDTFEGLDPKPGQPAMNVGMTNDPGGKHAPIKLVPTMLTLPCKVLTCHKPQFIRPHFRTGILGAVVGNNAVSRWKVPVNAQFFETKPRAALKYRFVVEDGFRNDFLAKYQGEFRKQLISKCGLDPRQIQELDPAHFDNLKTSEKTKARIGESKKLEANLVVFLVKKASIPFYANVRDMADRAHGIHSLCLVEKYNLLTNKDARKSRLWPEYIINVVMKVRLKLDGTTQSVQTVHDYLQANRIMVLGADVVHAGPGAFHGTSSIASIVGSVDFSAGKCLGSMRLQKVHEKDRETITTVEEMVRERLEAWANERKNDDPTANELPRSIIYYRDGVGSGQYDTIKTIEVSAIRRAYIRLAKEKGLSEDVNIHAVVVVKRHHTRLHALQASEGDPYGNGNTKPGTFVDRLASVT